MKVLFKRKESVPVTIRMDKDIHSRIVKFCEQSGRTRTLAIEQAVDYYVRDYKANQEIINRNILIVEDELIDRIKLRSFLGNEYNITEAENGKVALQLLQDGNPADLIITDLIMPEMDGIRFLAELAKIRNLDEFPVLVATGSDDIDVELKCLELGCSDFIRKPYNPQFLKMRVENTIERMEYNRLKQKRTKDTFGKIAAPNALKESVPISIRMEKTIYDRLVEFCEQSGQSKTLAIERAVEMYISNNEARQKTINSNC